MPDQFWTWLERGRTACLVLLVLGGGAIWERVGDLETQLWEVNNNLSQFKTESVKAIGDLQLAVTKSLNDMAMSNQNLLNSMHNRINRLDSGQPQ